MAEKASGTTNRSTPGVWFVLAPAIALVVGLLLGGLLVWAGQDDPSKVTAPDPDPTSSPTPSATAGEDTAVVVPSECLEAADTVEEATEVFRDLAGALRDFRADELRQLLTRLETLEAQARSQADACRDVQVSSTSTASPTG